MLIRFVFKKIGFSYKKILDFINIKNLKVLILVLLLCIVTISLTACYSNIDLTKIAIVSAVGFDKDDGGDIKITIQIVKPGVIKAKNQGSEEDTVWVYSAYGKTVFSAIRNLLTNVDRKAFYSHLQLMVISEELARDSILELFDLAERDKEIQRLSYVLIARGITAEEVIKARSELENIPAMHIKAIMDNNKSLAKIRKVTLIELLKCLNLSGFAATVGVVQKRPEMENKSEEIPDKNNQEVTGTVKQVQQDGGLEIKDLKIEGAAVFRLDRLAGYLGPFETRGLLFALDEVESGIINVDNPLHKNKKIGFEMVRSGTKLGVEIKDGQAELMIEVKAWGRLEDQQGAGNFTTPAMTKELEGYIAGIIETNIRSAVDKAQKEYHLDYFGFAKILYENHLSYWKEVEDDWNNIFSQLPVTIKASWNTNNSSLIKEPSVAR